MCYSFLSRMRWLMLTSYYFNIYLFDNPPDQLQNGHVLVFS